jgi:ribulose-phosphate 3-epimerase
MRMSKILPSIMAKDQQELNARIKKVGPISKTLHLDVVDGRYAKNLSLWFNIRLPSKFQYMAHLMVIKPLLWVRHYGYKMQVCIAQFEVVENVEHYIRYCKRHRLKVGFSLRPETKWKVLEPYLKDIDYVLILTVTPGFYGSAFKKSALKKIAAIKKVNSNIKFVVDGHMNPRTIQKVRDANYIVVGSYLQDALDVKKAMKELTSAVRR